MIEGFNPEELKKLYVPSPASHKGQNGKLMIIGGSKLFHSASLWSLQVASRIVDMVYYSSVPENNEIVQKAKEEFRNGIVVPRDQMESYIQEADAVLIGPGMMRSEKYQADFNFKNLEFVNAIENEGEQTYHLTKYLLHKYLNKKWIIDAGALQMMDAEWLRGLNGNVILTPHQKEFEKLFNFKLTNQQINQSTNKIGEIAEQYNCVILLKGQTDIVCSKDQCVEIGGGNAGMTKGGTGDVLAGLAAALVCKNDLFLAACAGSYINKRAGDELYKRVGTYFNASDLADEIPRVMKDAV